MGQSLYVLRYPLSGCTGLVLYWDGPWQSKTLLYCHGSPRIAQKCVKCLIYILYSNTIYSNTMSYLYIMYTETWLMIMSYFMITSIVCKEFALPWINSCADSLTKVRITMQTFVATRCIMPNFATTCSREK